MAILLLLQQREQVTAAQVADELEISERTARRDLDALAMAGIPVYSVQGRGGGWRLAGGGRTDLSGLTAAEARALFLVASPHARSADGVRSALRKLVRALPEPLRDDAEAAAGAIAIDPTGWDAPRDPAPTPPLLDALQDAVIRRRQVQLSYLDRHGRRSDRTVHPLGIAAKGSTWYLVAETDAGRRTFRVDRVVEAEVTDHVAQRPADFDLNEVWHEVVAQMDAMRTPILAHATVEADLVPHLRKVFGARLAIGSAAPGERVPVELRGHNVRALASEVAGFGPWMTVADPPELLDALAEVGRSLVAAYDPLR